MRALRLLRLGVLIALSAAGQQNQRGTIPAPQRGQDLRKGVYYALVIGVDRYQHLPVLKPRRTMPPPLKTRCASTMVLRPGCCWMRRPPAPLS